MPYMGYIGMCRCEGYGFQAVYSRIGYSEDISDVASTVTQYSWLAKSDKNKRND